MKNEDLPEGLPLEDQMAYVTMRNIYQAYKAGQLSRESAAEEKKLVRTEYERLKDKLAFQDALAESRATCIRNTEQAIRTCRKDPTPENAVRLCDVLDGLSKS